MKDQDKTEEKLINELRELRQRIAELEAAEIEYKRVEEALRESEERYRDIVELAPDGILTGNLKGVATSCNSAFLELTGFSRDEIVGTHISKFPTLRIQDIPKYAKIIFSAIQGKTIKPFEFKWVHKDGTEHWGEAHLGLMKKGSKVIGLQFILRDITERRRAEDALRESEEKFRTLINQTVDMLLLHDMDGKIIDVNRSSVEQYGYTREELLSMTLADLDPDYVKREDGGKFWDQFEPDDWLRFEARQKRKNGSIFPVEVTISLVMLQGETCVMGLCRDITERKRAEEEALRQSNRRLEKALTELRETQEQMVHQERMAAVGQLSAGIAHDFNNILAAITLYTQMSLKMSDLPPTIRKRLEVISGQANRAADLIQQILDFGRRAVIERSPLAVDSFLKEVVKLLKRTLPEHVQIDLMIEAGEHVINADPTRVQQAIVNLALNARDAMPDGGMLHIALSTVEDKKIDCVECGSLVTKGKWVKIEVRDSGTGIPPDVLPHIFEPFFTTRAPLGHGLGLAQVYGIVMQHDGHLEVETEIGLGTTFRLYWPALLVTKPDDQATAQPDVCRGEGQTILVVEDDAIMRTALAEVLETLGYRTLEAANGQEALAVCEEHKQKISLVLSDWVMPSMGGGELARQLEARHIAIKVLMLTGHPLDEERRSVMPDNVIGWVLKPPRLERLAEAVAQGLGE